MYFTVPSTLLTRPSRSGPERDAEVHDPGRALLGQENVGRLDVAMDDPCLVRVTEAVQHLGDDRDLLPERQRRSLPQPGQEVLALEQLHHDVGRAVGVIPQVEDGHDAGVTEAGDRPSFPLEPLFLLRVPRRLREHDLEGDLALENGVESPVDGPHAPPSERLDDLVLADSEATGRVRGGWR